MCCLCSSARSLRLDSVHGPIVEVVLARPRRVVHAEDVQERRLAGARRAHDRDELPLLDVQVDPPQDEGLRGALLEALLDVPKANHARLLDVLLDDPAVKEVDRAVRVTGKARVVRDHADRRAARGGGREQLHHRIAVLRIEVSRRLVGEQNERPARECSGDGDALLLTAGELAGEVLRAMSHADLFERFRHPLASAPLPACPR